MVDDGNSDRKTKGTKERVTKWRLKFNDHKHCLLNNKIKSKSQESFNSKTHLKSPYIPDHSYRILIFGASGWVKTIALLNLIKN